MKEQMITKMVTMAVIITWMAIVTIAVFNGGDSDGDGDNDFDRKDNDVRDDE